MVRPAPKVAAWLVAALCTACELVAGINDRKAGTHVGPGGGPDGAAANDGFLSDGPAADTQFLGASDATFQGQDSGVGVDDAALGGAGGTSSTSISTGGSTEIVTSGGTSGTSTTGTTVTTGGSTGVVIVVGGAFGFGGVAGSSSSTGGAGGAAPDAPKQVDAPAADVASDPPGCPTIGVLGTGTGLLGQYFVTPTFTDPQLERVDSTIDFNWPGAPDRALPPDGFWVRWTGSVQPRFSGSYTFTTRSDDGVRVWIDGTLIIDDWVNHAVNEKSGTATLVAGQLHDIKVEYFEGDGLASIQLLWASACQPQQIIPAGQLYPPAVACPTPSIGTGTGLIGSYYDNPDLTVLAATRTDEKIFFVWPDGSTPIVGVAPGTFSVRWTGQVQAEFTGWTTFHVVSDDGVRLFLDDTLVIDDWTSHGRTEDSVTLKMTAGQRYNLRLEYFEQSGGGQVQLWWSSLCLPKEVIPTAQLYGSYTGAICDNPSVGDGTGLTGTYFDTNNFTNPVVTHPAEVVNFNWGLASPAPGVAPDTFSVRWTGKVMPRYSGTTTFYTVSDDAARLWIDGQMVIDDWVGHEAHQAAGNANLNAGQLHDVVLEYREDLLNASISLSWSSPCQAKEIIPTAQLFPSFVKNDAGPPDLQREFPPEVSDTKSDLPEPDLAEPDLPGPDLPEPDLAEPDLPEPDLAEPDLAEPDLADAIEPLLDSSLDDV